MNKLSSNDRSALLRLASSLPVGDESRKVILAGLQKTSTRKWVEDRDSGYWSYQENGNGGGGSGSGGEKAAPTRGQVFHAKGGSELAFERATKEYVVFKPVGNLTRADRKSLATLAQAGDEMRIWRDEMAAHVTDW